MHSSASSMQPGQLKNGGRGHYGRGRGRMSARVRQPESEYQEEGELPSVDDLEVAAAAATAADEHGFHSMVSQFDAARVSQMRQEAAVAESDDDESSSDEEAEGNEEMDHDATSAAGDRVVAVTLHAEGDTVRVVCELIAAVEEPAGSTAKRVLRKGDKQQKQKQKAADGAESSSDSEEDTDMAVLLERMVAVDNEYEAPAEGVDPEVVPPLGQQQPIQISPDDKLLPAGTVSAVVEGMLVVQARELMRALDIESVLCLEDRTPLGRVEEVFGPVTKPLYALRYAGSGDAEAAVKAGTHVFVVENSAVYVDPQEVQKPALRPVDDTGDDAEVEFSDDEAELEWKRRMAKRPSDTVPAGAQPLKGSGGRGRGDGGGGGGRGRGGRHSGHGRGGAPPPQSPSWQQPSGQPGAPPAYYAAMASAQYLDPGQQAAPPMGGGAPAQYYQGAQQYAAQPGPSDYQQQAQQQQYRGGQALGQWGQQQQQGQFMAQGPAYGMPPQQYGFQVPPGYQLVAIPSGQPGLQPPIGFQQQQGGWQQQQQQGGQGYQQHGQNGAGYHLQQQRQIGQGMQQQSHFQQQQQQQQPRPPPGSGSLYSTGL